MNTAKAVKQIAETKEQLAEMKVKVTNHLRRNKVTYITGAACLVAGAVGGGTVLARKPEVQAVQKIVGVLNWQPTQILHQESVMVRRGHPGYVVVCNETGEKLASLRRMAEVMKIDRSDLRKHLRGDLPHVKGHTFTKLGEAQAA